MYLQDHEFRGGICRGGGTVRLLYRRGRGGSVCSQSVLLGVEPHENRTTEYLWILGGNGRYPRNTWEGKLGETQESTQ